MQDRNPESLYPASTLAASLSCYTPAVTISAIDTLIFDLDDTLVVEEASAEAAFIEAGELARIRHGLDPRELHATVRKTCRELWYGFPSHPFCKRVGISSWEAMWAEFTGPDRELKPLRDWAPEYRLESWRAALRAHGIDDPDLAAALAEAFPRLRRNTNVVCPDAKKVLDAFSPSYKLGLLTNGASDLQRRKIEGAGLAGYFDHFFIAGESGVGKPDRRAFEMLLERLGSTARQSIMIGDRLATDVLGAHEAGMRAVWVNRSGERNHGPIIPDWEIHTLEELLSILNG